MSVGISTKGIKPFDGNNFQGWKSQINALFVMNEVLDVVDGTRTRPTAIAGNQAELKQFQKDNATAKFIILSTLEESQQICVLSYETAKEMWDKLVLIHEQKSVTNKLGLMQKFHSYSMCESDSAVQHVSRVLNMASQLKDIGEPVSDTTIMAKILASLTPRFSTLQIAWDSVDPGRQTLDYLQERLIREDMRAVAEESAVSALVASNKADSEKSTKSKKTVKCYRCQGIGHFARFCKKARRKFKYGDEKSREGDCAFLVENNVGSVATTVSSQRIESTQSQVDKVMSAKQTDAWLIDSGASRHLTFRKDWLTDYRPCNSGDTVSLGDNKVYEVTGEGTVHINKLVNGVWESARIEKVMYVPGMRKNLFSVGACVKKGFEVNFCRNNVEIARNGNVIANGKIQNNDVYRMLFEVVKTGNVEEGNISTTSVNIWHERLGHVGQRAITEMVRKSLVKGVNLKDKTRLFCESCKLGKSHRLPFNKSAVKVKTKPGEVIHTDVCGPMSVESVGKSRYFLTFKDDSSGFRHVYFLREKSEVCTKFKEFEKMVANKFGKPIKILRSDNGREFCNQDFKNYLVSRGISHETTAPHTPEQNGKAERDNRTIVESARTMLLAKNLPKNLWAEAVNCAVYVLNRTVWFYGRKTPYEAWVGKTPDLSHLKIFGSEAFANIPKQFTRKLDARARKVIFVGYKENSSNYRVYDPATRKVSEARDVVFNEQTATVLEIENETDDEDEIVVPVTKSARQKEPENEPEEVQEEEFEDALTEREASTSRVLRDRATIKSPKRYVADVAEYCAPNSYEEAMNSNYAAQWANAIEEELSALMRNKTWSIVPREEQMVTIDSRWVFRLKKDEDKQTHRFKARLCARGFKQRKGIDYTETFAPVIRYDSLRVFLALVASKDLELVQFDIQTAFLFGKLKETIFMELPEGLDIGEEKDGIKKGVVCKLERSLYGLKQAPRCWNQRFSQFLSDFEFVEGEADKYIFVGHYKSEPVYLALFVDDGLIASKSQKALDFIVNQLNENFRITKGDSNVFVGVQIVRNREEKSLIIHQSEYTRKIIKKFNMSNAKSVSVPSDPNVILYPLDKEEKSSQVPYREAVGSLVFLAAVTRPDIAYAVNSVSKFLNNHSEEHWHAVKRIFSYLIGTTDLGIEYKNGGSEPKLIGYSDSDFAGDVENRRSTTGCIFCFSGGAITWSSQRQKLVTLSTTEAEYVAASTGARELIWLRKLLKDFGCPCEGETSLFIDNQSAIQLAKNPVFHKRTKHIDIHYHFIREKVENGEMSVKYVSSEAQLADILTKALTRDRFKKLCNELNMKCSIGGSVKK